MPQSPQRGACPITRCASRACRRRKRTSFALGTAKWPRSPRCSSIAHTHTHTRRPALWWRCRPRHRAGTPGSAMSPGLTAHAHRQTHMHMALRLQDPSLKQYVHNHWIHNLRPRSAPSCRPHSARATPRSRRPGRAPSACPRLPLERLQQPPPNDSGPQPPATSSPLVAVCAPPTTSLGAWGAAPAHATGILPGLKPRRPNRFGHKPGHRPSNALPGAPNTHASGSAQMASTGWTPTPPWPWS